MRTPAIGAVAAAVVGCALAAERIDPSVSRIQNIYSNHVNMHRPHDRTWSQDAPKPDDVRFQILSPRHGEEVVTRGGELRVRFWVQGMEVPRQGYFGVYFDNDTELELPCGGMTESEPPREYELRVDEVEPAEHRFVLVAQLRSGAYGLKGVNFTTVEGDAAYSAPAPRVPLGIRNPDAAARSHPRPGFGPARFTVAGRPKVVTRLNSGRRKAKDEL